MSIPSNPSRAASGANQPGERALTSTKWIPASIVRASAASVRSETEPSERRSVPSRSLATRRTCSVVFRDDPGMEQRISLVTLGVADVARSRAFYEALGWNVGVDAGAEIAFFQVGPMVFSLW